MVVVVGLVRRRKGENKIGQLGGRRLDLEARAGQAQAELASNSVHPTRYQPCQPVGFFFCAAAACCEVRAVRTVRIRAAEGEQSGVLQSAQQ